MRLLPGPACDVPEAVGAGKCGTNRVRQEPASQRKLHRVPGGVLRGRNLRGVELGFGAARRRRSAGVQGRWRPVLLLLAEELRWVRHPEAKGLQLVVGRLWPAPHTPTAAEVQPSAGGVRLPL